MKLIEQLRGWLTAIREYDDIVKEFGILSNSYYELQGKYAKLSLDNASLKIRLDYFEGVKELEYYWNNKRKKVNKQWKARDGVNMDVRVFFQRNFNLPKFTGTNDEKAKKILGYVIAMIKYKRDNGEFWQYAYETMKRREGDCEDMGILVANILWNNEVPYWRIRLVKGWVDYKEDESYHVWCTYLAEDNNWYVLDGAYWPRESTGLKLKWKDAEKYLSVDASWNSEFSFGGLNK